MLDTKRRNFWCERVTITPAEAKAILDADNLNNRDLSRCHQKDDRRYGHGQMEDEWRKPQIRQ